MSPKQAPYGTWTSPIGVDIVGGVGIPHIVEIIVDPITSKVYYLETRPAENGRNALIETSTNKEVLPGINVRTSVHEYGGAPAIIYNDQVIYSNFADGRVYVNTEPVTPENPLYRFADFTIHPIHNNLIVCILEDHTVDTPSTVLNSLCTIDTNTKTISSLLSGADFYASPRFSPDGKHLVWQQWWLSDMPWEGAVINIAESDGTNVRHVAGEKLKTSAAYPVWLDNDTIVFTSDASGFQNPWIFDCITGHAKPILAEPVAEDFSPPGWQLGFSPFCLLDSGIGLFSATNGLYVVDIHNGTYKDTSGPFVVSTYLRRAIDGVVFLGSKHTQKPAVIRWDTTAFTELTTSNHVIPTDMFSIPQSITLRLPKLVHVLFYPPHNPEYAGMEGERPPCIVNAHGGPTSSATQELNWWIQYYTSRGWAWLDVNYGGSSGYGREYMNRLASNWGVTDSEETIAAALTLASQPYSLIDSKRMVVRGGSAGGFTALCCVSTAVNQTAFAACTSMYGISDCVGLALLTHKFEMGYPVKLFGGSLEEHREVYEQRSPVRSARRIETPLLLLQGVLDRVVPKEQSELIYEDVKARGGIAELKLYEGEGHGWRKEATIRDALVREESFYQKVLGLQT